MPVYGDLNTMSLTDLMQWASANQKTGVLELERNKIYRRIEFRKGWIAACSSDDPPSLLGQFLLARGKITEDALRQALARQESSRRNLGLILMEMGEVTQAELGKQIGAKAEDVILGLFDWNDAIFRFDEGATLDPNQIEVRLAVRDVLLKGIQHHDEMQKIRQVFSSSGIVLRRTDRPAPAELLSREISRRIYDSVDGDRTMAEILLHARASEFLVIKLLYRLHRLGLVEIAEVRPPAADAQTLLDGLARQEATVDFGGPAAPSTGTPSTADSPKRGRSDEGLEAELEVAKRLMSRGEHEAALELLNASYRAHPGDGYLKRLIAKAEAAYVQTVRGQELGPDKIPAVVAEVDPSALTDLGPQESFLLSLIDGRADIKSILWLTPLREVEALAALGKMLKRGLIELRIPESADTVVEFAGAEIDELE